MKISFSYIKNHKMLLSIIVVIAGLGYYFTQGTPEALYETTDVKQGTVAQTVSVTGRVESDSIVALSFERGGRVVSQPLSVGTHVKNGTALVRLDSSELSALRQQASANLDYELVRLVELNRGARDEDVAISRAQVESAETTLRDAGISLADKLKNAVTVADDGVFSKTDYFFYNPKTLNPKLNFVVSDQNLIDTVEYQRVNITNDLNEIDLSRNDFEVSLVLHKEYFSKLKIYFDNLAQIVNSVPVSSAYPQTTIDGWKSDVSLARTNLNTTLTTLLSGEQSYRAASAALAVANQQLSLKEAGPTAETVALQEARIRSAKATLANYDAQITKTVLYAPFPGVITRQDAKKGETVSPNSPIVELMSDGQWKITTNAPEVDVAKISIGNDADVTLDAYGSDVVFKAIVSNIDPAETIIEGVSTYKITLRFIKADERIRSGMTANIDMQTDKREDVLYIPLRAVVTRDGIKYVNIPDGVGQKEIPVILGLRGSGGTVEVVDGLSLGQSIITFTPN